MNSSSDPTAFGIEGHVLQFEDMADALINNREPKVNQYEGKNRLKSFWRFMNPKRPVRRCICKLLLNFSDIFNKSEQLIQEVNIND